MGTVDTLKCPLPGINECDFFFVKDHVKNIIDTDHQTTRVCEMFGHQRIDN
jgi:hypothetical protein